MSPTPPHPNTAQAGDTGIAGNAGVAMFAKVFYLASRLLVPPLVLAHISLAEYGLWSACFVLIMYIGLADAGFSNVYVRFVARFHAEGRLDDINRLLSTGVLTLAGIASLVLLALWLGLPLVLDMLKVDAGQRDMASVLVMGAAGMFLLDLTLGAYCYLLHGLQRIREEQKVAIVGYALELVLIFLFLQAGLGVYSLLLAFALRYTWSLLSFIRLAHRFVPTLSLSVAHFSPAMLRHFLGFGSAVQASALLGTALFTLDRLLAGYLLGPKGIALFELGAKLPVAAVSVPSAISQVTLPAAAHHHARQDQTALRTLYVQSSRAISLLAGLPLGFMALFAAPIAAAWLGPNEAYAQLPLILTLSALTSHLHIITGPGSSIFRAMGQVGNEFVYHGLRLVALPIAIGLSLHGLGVNLTGLVVGLSAGGTVAALAYLLHNQRQLKLPARALLHQILLPGFLAYPVASALLACWQVLLPASMSRWQMLAGLLAFGVFYSVACLWMFWRFVLQRSEREYLLAMLAPLLNRALKWRNP